MSSGILTSGTNRMHITEENISKIENSDEVKKVFQHTSLDSFTVGDMFHWIGYIPEWDYGCNEIIGLDSVGEEASMMFEEFMMAIAPYVEDGSFLECEEYNEATRTVFKDGKVEKITPTVIWGNGDYGLCPDVSVHNEAQGEMVLSITGKDYIKISDSELYNEELCPTEQINNIVHMANIIGVKLSQMVEQSNLTHEGETIIGYVLEDDEEQSKLSALFAILNGYTFFMEYSLTNFYENSMKELGQTKSDDDIQAFRNRFILSNESHDRCWFVAIKEENKRYPTIIHSLENDMDIIFNTSEFLKVVEPKEDADFREQDMYFLFGKEIDMQHTTNRELNTLIFNEYLKFIHKEGGELNPKLDIVQEAIAKNTEKRKQGQNKESVLPSAKQ